MFDLSNCCFLAVSDVKKENKKLSKMNNRKLNLKEIQKHASNATVGALFAESINFGKKKYGTLFLGAIVMGLIALVIGMVQQVPNSLFEPNWTLVGVSATILSILGMSVRFALVAGIYTYGVKEEATNEAEFSDFFAGFQKFKEFFIYGLLYALIMLVCFVPAIITSADVFLTAIQGGDPSSIIEGGMMGFGIGFGLSFILLMLVTLFLSHTMGILATYDVQVMEAVKASYQIVKKQLGFHILTGLSLFGVYIGMALLVAFTFGIGAILILGMIPFFISFAYKFFQIVCYPIDQEEMSPSLGEDILDESF